MLNLFSKAFVSITVLTAIAVGTGLAQTPAKEKKVKDQQEYDLYTQASPAKTPDPQKRLAALKPPAVTTRLRI